MATTELPVDVSTAVVGPSQHRLALRRFMRNRLALISGVFLVIVILSAVFAPLIARFPPDQVDLFALQNPPSAKHWLGTDGSGRDVFSRLLYAGRVSLMVGVSAALLSVVMGTVLGALAGLVRGVVEAAIMRIVDVMLGVPAIVVMIVVAGIIGPSIPILVATIGFTHWPGPCRIAQGVTLSVREKDFVAASRVGGAGPWRLIYRHIVPSILPPLIVASTLAVAQAILLEAGMSFLGVGVQPPTASWGNMLNDAQSLTIISSMPWLWIPPGLAIALTVLAVNFVGDGLRDGLDPRQSGGR